MAKKVTKRSGKAWAQKHQKDIQLLDRAGWKKSIGYIIERITLEEFKNRCQASHHNLLNEDFFKEPEPPKETKPKATPKKEKAPTKV